MTDPNEFSKVSFKTIAQKKEFEIALPQNNLNKGKF